MCTYYSGRKNSKTDVMGMIIMVATVSLVVVISSILTMTGSGWAFDGQEKSLVQKGMKACSKTAINAYKACRNEMQDDYWIAVGNCNNLSNPDDRASCMKIAKENLEESAMLCKAQQEARLDICTVLGEAPYDPMINSSDFIDFQSVISGKKTFTPNPYFPLIPGLKKVYIVKDAGGNKLEKILVEILQETKKILGVNCIVVRDRVWEFDEEGNKVLIEDTLDWYTQDFLGNVWYFGEIVKNFEDGELVDVDGSWKAGRDFEKAGIIMLSAPQEGDLYRQEFSLGNAEDMAEVVRYLDSMAVAGKSYKNVLQTKDFTPIEPEVIEYKYYAPGVGMIFEEKPESGKQVLLQRIMIP